MSWRYDLLQSFVFQFLCNQDLSWRLKLLIEVSHADPFAENNWGSNNCLWRRFWRSFMVDCDRHIVKKETTSSHDARMIRHLGFRVCTCKIQHQLLMSTITTCILSMNLPWWNFWKKLSKTFNTCRAAALGSSGMIITCWYQILVYQRHTPQDCGWMQRKKLQWKKWILFQKTTSLELSTGLGLPNFLHI